MWANKWVGELEKMLTNIEHQTTSSLQIMENGFEQSGESFHRAHKKYCIDRVKDR